MKRGMSCLVLVAGLVAPAPIAAQTYWRVPAALGGGLIGAGAGYLGDLVLWNSSGCTFCGPKLVMTTAGIGTGTLLGFVGGLSADRRLARGDSLGSGTRGMLRFMTFAAPVAVGSAVAFSIINPPTDYCVWNAYSYCTEPPPPAVSDETVAALGIGGGVLLGYVLQHRYSRALYPRPRVSVLPARGGVRLAYSAAW